MALLYLLSLVALTYSHEIHDANDTCGMHFKWGRRSFYEPSGREFIAINQEDLEILNDIEKREEKITGAGKAMLDFVMEDLVKIVPDNDGYINTATPALDLSNLRLNAYTSKLRSKKIFNIILESISR